MGRREQEILRRMSSPGRREIVIDPAPESWAALKPTVLPLLSGPTFTGRDRPTLVGYPLCAMGESWRALAKVSGRAVAHHEACGRCSRAERCSPPTAWNDRELQPFGPCEMRALWGRYHARFAGASGAPRSDIANTLVDRHAETVQALAIDTWELEPSFIIASGQIEPRTRLVVFHGELPASPDRAVAQTLGLIEGLAALHRATGSEMPLGLRDVLRENAPFEMPVGFEVGPSGVLLKGYARLRHTTPARRRALCESLASLLPVATSPAILQLLDSSDGWRDVDMIGWATRDGELVGAKVYISRDARVGWPAMGLPRIPQDHPFEVLSRHRAYAVIDLVHPETRANKVDYYLRERLLSGPMLTSFVRRLWGAEVAAPVRMVADHHDFRVDLVAGALRGDAWAFYCALG